MDQRSLYAGIVTPFAYGPLVKWVQGVPPKTCPVSELAISDLSTPESMAYMWRWSSTLT